MNFDTLLFDLDGTLVDTSEGITKSVSYALGKRGYVGHSPQSLKCFIGPPLREQFMAFTGTDLSEGTALVTAYREYYTQKGIFECRVYDGIPALLERLKKRGKRLLVATSKPERFAHLILEHFSIDGYFDFIGGAALDNTRTDKAEVIRYTLQGVGLQVGFSEKAVMIGDSQFDVLGAKAVGLPAIGVTYGFGDIEKLKAAAPLCLCSSVKELEKLFS